MPVTLVAVESDLVVNREYTIASGITKTFIPEESGYYRFTSTGYGDPKITVYCNAGEYSFDDSDGYDFDGSVYLEKDETVSCYIYNYHDEDSVIMITKSIGPESISFTPSEPIEIILGGSAVYEDECNASDCDLCEGVYYRYSYSSFLWGGILTVNYTDGSSVDYIGNGEGGFVADNGEQIWDEDLSFSDNQSYEHWVEPGEKSFALEYMGCTTNVPVTLVAVESDLVANEEYTIASETTKIFVPEESGYYRFASNGYGDPKITITCRKGEYSFDDNNGLNFDGIVYLTKGEVVSCYIYNYEGENSVFTITKVEVPQSITVNLNNSIELLEHTGGYWDEYEGYDDDDEYFTAEYYVYTTPVSQLYREGNTITLNYSDGTSDVYTCGGNEYRNSAGVELDFECESNQSYKNQWLIGSDNYFTISYMDVEVEVPVTITENNIASISYSSAGSQSWLENDNGYYDYYYDSETYEESEWFRYVFYQQKGDILNVRYTDNTEREYIYDGQKYCSADGKIISENEVSFSDDQSYTNQWTLGNSYEFTISYAGKETKISINIVGISSCSFTPAEPIVLYKNYHLSDGGYFIDEFEEGNIFTIHYTDGSKKEYFCGYKESVGHSGWFDENGKELNGYIYSYAEGSEKWDIGEHSVTITYDDYDSEQSFTTEIKVTLIESPVESISLSLSEEIVFTEGIDSYRTTGNNGVSYYNAYNISEWTIPYGSTLTISYKDGSSEMYTLNEVWYKEDMQYYPTFETADGKRIKGYDWFVDDKQHENHWSVGENEFTLSVYGVATQIPVLVKENNVESFYIDYGDEIIYEQGTNGFFEKEYIEYDVFNTFFVEYYMYKYWLGEDGWELVVNYKDGTSETYVCEVHEDYETGSRVQWYNSSRDQMEVVWESDQHYDNQWGVGTHYVTAVCMGKTMQIPVKIVANENCNHSYVNGFCSVCKAEDPSYTIPVLSVGETETVTISNAGDCCYLYFTPAKNGVYSFSSPCSYDEDSDSPYCVVYDSNFTGLKTFVSWHESHQAICGFFEAGKKYIIKCGYDSSYATGSFEVSCDFVFYTADGVRIMDNYMFIPALATDVSDFATVSDKSEFEYTASCSTSGGDYYGTGSQFVCVNSFRYTIIVEGDLNGDSVCDVLDVAEAERYSTGADKPSMDEVLAANGCISEEIDAASYQNVVNVCLAG